MSIKIKDIRKVLGHKARVIDTSPEFDITISGMVLSSLLGEDKPPVVVFGTEQGLLYIEFTDLGHVRMKKTKEYVEFSVPHGYYTTKKYKV